MRIERADGGHACSQQMCYAKAEYRLVGFFWDPTYLCASHAEELCALEIPKRRYVLKRTYWNTSSGNEKCHPCTRDVDFFQVIDVVNLSAQAAGLFCEPCAQAVADALESRR